MASITLSVQYSSFTISWAKNVFSSSINVFSIASIERIPTCTKFVVWLASYTAHAWLYFVPSYDSLKSACASICNTVRLSKHSLKARIEPMDIECSPPNNVTNLLRLIKSFVIACTSLTIASGELFSVMGSVKWIPCL